MNILLIGECYSANLGDAVICQTVKNMIVTEYPEAQVTLFDISGKIDYQNFSNDLSYSFIEKCFIKLTENFPIIFCLSSFYNLYKTNELRYLRTMVLLRTLLRDKRFDGAVFVGGAMFMDYFAGLIYYTVRLLSIKNIPVIFHACGMGDLSTSGIALLRRTFKFNCVKNISVRDSNERFLQFFGDIIIPTETYDTAICCNQFFGSSSKKIAEYGIGVISLKQHYDLQKDIITYFKNSNSSFKVFTNGADEETAISLLKDCGYSEMEIDNMLMKRPRSPEELVYNITSFEKIISFRMHSLIVANSYGIEVRGFVWDDKVYTYLNKLGYPEWCCFTNQHECFECLKWENARMLSLNQKIKELSDICKKDLLKELNIIFN